MTSNEAQSGNARSIPVIKWYWHRLRAMTVSEMLLRARKKARQRADMRGPRDWPDLELQSGSTFPALPNPAEAPPMVRETLRRDSDRILSGRWRAFGHLELQVDDPPCWHKDYLAETDLATSASAFKLNHRQLPNGADVKLIWELSRWYELTRLAMAAYVLGDTHAAEKCVAWLEDWVRHNPPYHGWNWASALEAGMRLVQFTWIDALLSKMPNVRFETAARIQERLSALRAAILPAHVWFTWRHRSFGSSANNHLIGELAGLILATTRWPQLTALTANRSLLQLMWEREVMLQFAPDGGNREQALNYHLFSFELCWQVREAIHSTGEKISIAVEERLFKAADFFWNVQVGKEPWDYGDSDSAYGMPFFGNEQTLVSEWRRWLAGKESPALRFWLGGFPETSPLIGFGPPAHAHEAGPWWHYRDTGIAVIESGFWFLRWDLSPLGYPRTAAHGHLDALHVSVWVNGVAFVIDPGTGAYYGETALRTWLASRSAHNAPCPASGEWPERAGPFLWAEQHSQPVLKSEDDAHVGVLNLRDAQVRRRFVEHSPNLSKWSVEDSVVLKNGRPGSFSVRWQFAPGTWIKRVAPRRFVLKRRETSIQIEASDDWAEAYLVETQKNGLSSEAAGNELERTFAGTVSPAFRKVEWAPYLKLIARPKPGQTCVFRTTFVASPAS
jgi:hypothetical protein